MKTAESLLTAVLCALSQKLQMKHGNKNPQKVIVTDISRSEEKTKAVVFFLWMMKICLNFWKRVIKAQISDQEH